MGVYFQLRDLEEGDYDRGYIQLLSNLTEMDKVSKDAFLDQYKMLEDNDNYVIRVIVDKENDKVIASGTVLIEHKFIYNLGSIGHMEDIVVDKDYRQGGHGRQIVLDLVRIGRNRGLYKISLICSNNVTGFYEKCGFEVKAHEMVRSYK